MTASPQPSFCVPTVGTCAPTVIDSCICPARCVPTSDRWVGSSLRRLFERSWKGGPPGVIDMHIGREGFRKKKVVLKRGGGGGGGWGGPWSTRGHWHAGRKGRVSEKKVGFKEGWSFFRVVIHQDGLHQGGHSSGWSSSGWSFIRVVFQQWSFIRLIIRQGRISTGCQSSGSYFHRVSFIGSSSSGWSFNMSCIRVIFIMVVVHQDSLSTGCPQGHLHQGDHSSGWSLIRVVFLQGSTVYADTCTMTGGMIYLYSVWHIQASQKRRKPSGWASLRVDWFSLFMWRVRCSQKRRKPSRKRRSPSGWIGVGYSPEGCVSCSGVQRRRGSHQGGSPWGMRSHQIVLGDGSGWFQNTQSYGRVPCGWVRTLILIFVALSTCIIWCLFPVSSLMFLPVPPFLLVILLNYFSLIWYQ